MLHDDPKTTSSRDGWCAAYRAAFIAFALSRGWDRENAEAWSDDIVSEAAIAYWPDITPDDAALKDVPECEWESVNAC